jgi:hypothetical protein
VPYPIQGRQELSKMYKLPKILFLALALFSLFFSVKAQSGADEPEVETRYNKDKDETEIEITQIPISVDNSKLAFLGVTAVFKGQKVSKPDFILFIVSVISVGNYKYPSINQVVLTSEGKSFGEIVMLNLDQRKLSENEFLETIGTRMKFDIFKKFLASKKVSFQMGTSNFQVGESQISKLIEFEKVINP